MEKIEDIKKTFSRATKNYSKKTGFRSNKLRHCAYIIYSMKTRFLKGYFLLTEKRVVTRKKFFNTSLKVYVCCILCSNGGSEVMWFKFEP